MLNRSSVLPLVALTLLIYAFLFGGPIPSWGAIHRTAGIVGFVLLVWDYYLWRFPWFYPKLVPAPKLRGTWEAEATIFDLPGPTGLGKVTVDCEQINGHLVIRQTSSGFMFTAFWDDGHTSVMKHLSPVTGSDGRGVFVGQYDNREGITIGVAGVVVFSAAEPGEARLYYTTIEAVPQRGLVLLKKRVRQFPKTREEIRDLPQDSKRTIKHRLEYFFCPW